MSPEQLLPSHSPHSHYPLARARAHAHTGFPIETSKELLNWSINNKVLVIMLFSGEERFQESTVSDVTPDFAPQSSTLSSVGGPK